MCADLMARVCKCTHDVLTLVYCDTGLEWASVRRFVDYFADWLRETYGIEVDLVKLKPQKYDRHKQKYVNYSFRDIIIDYGYPVVSKEQAQFIEEYRNTRSEKLRKTRLEGNEWGLGKISEKWKYLLDAPFKISSKCCKIMKKLPAERFEKETGLHPVLATMTEESVLRLQKWMQHGCNMFDGTRPISKPMSFWTEQDVLRYLYEYQIPFADAYGEIVKENERFSTTGEKRTGCVFCLFAISDEKEYPNKFERLREAEPKKYDFCMKSIEEGGLGLSLPLQWLNIEYNRKG